MAMVPSQMPIHWSLAPVAAPLVQMPMSVPAAAVAPRAPVSTPAAAPAVIGAPAATVPALLFTDSWMIVGRGHTVTRPPLGASWAATAVARCVFAVHGDSTPSPVGTRSWPPVIAAPAVLVLGSESDELTGV